MVFPSVELLPVTVFSNTCIPPPSSVLLRKWRQTFKNLFIIYRNAFSSVFIIQLDFIHLLKFLTLQFPFSSDLGLCFLLLIFLCLVSPVTKRSPCSNSLWVLWRLRGFNLHSTSAPLPLYELLYKYMSIMYVVIRSWMKAIQCTFLQIFFILKNTN